MVGAPCPRLERPRRSCDHPAAGSRPRPCAHLPRCARRSRPSRSSQRTGRQLSVNSDSAVSLDSTTTARQAECLPSPSTTSATGTTKAQHSLGIAIGARVRSSRARRRGGPRRRDARQRHERRGPHASWLRACSRLRHVHTLRQGSQESASARGQPGRFFGGLFPHPTVGPTERLAAGGGGGLCISSPLQGYTTPFSAPGS